MKKLIFLVGIFYILITSYAEASCFKKLGRFVEKETTTALKQTDDWIKKTLFLLSKSY